MNQQRYLDRKQYVEEAKNSFDTRPEKRRRRETVREQEDNETLPKSYFRLRLLLAALLFAGYVVLQTTGWSYQGIDAAAIREKISGSIALPESFPALSELVTVTEEQQTE